MYTLNVQEKNGMINKSMIGGYQITSSYGEVTYELG